MQPGLDGFRRQRRGQQPGQRPQEQQHELLDLVLVLQRIGGQNRQGALLRGQEVARHPRRLRVHDEEAPPTPPGRAHLRDHSRVERK